MIEQKLTAAKADNIQIKQLYESAFPENERIPWPDLVRLIDEMQRERELNYSRINYDLEKAFLLYSVLKFSSRQ